MNDWIIFIFIYAAGISWMLRYSLSHPIMSDRVLEHEVFNRMVRGESWMNDQDYTPVDVNNPEKGYGVIPSCVMTTLFPYLIYRLLAFLRWGGSAELIFKMTSNTFFALTPAFVYLISRQYLDVGLSVIVSAFLFSNFFFLYSPDLGRVGVGIGMASGLVWALITGNPLAIIFSILLVISHYGVAFHLLFVLGLTVFITAPSILIVTLITLILSMGIWYGLIMKTTGATVALFVKRTFSLRSRALTRPRVSSARGLGHSSLGSVMVATETRQEVTSVKDRLRSFLKVAHRDPVLQVAFGRAFRLMETPQKIELIMTWVMTLTVTAGVILAKDIFFPFHMAMAGFMMLSMAGVMVIPHASVYYGTIRTYTTALIVLAPCFVIATNQLSGVLGIHEYVIPLFLIGMYALCVSGQVHWIFGIDKRATQRYMESMVRTSGEGTY